MKRTNIVTGIPIIPQIPTFSVFEKRLNIAKKNRYIGIDVTSKGTIIFKLVQEPSFSRKDHVLF